MQTIVRVVWGASCLSVWLGALGCGDNGGTTLGASEGATSTETQGTTQGTTPTSTVTATSSSTSAGSGSDSMDVDTNSPTSAPTTTNTSTTDATTGGPGTSATETSGSTTAVSAGSSGGSTGGSSGGPSGCMTSADCPQDEACVLGECVPFDGTCVGNADCHGDTYCCKNGCLPNGENPGVCIDFGLQPEGGSHDDCEGLVPVGLFQPSVQCEWLGPPLTDPYPNHKNVLTTPLAAPLPHFGSDSTELVVVAYNFTDGGAQSGYGSDPNYFGVIRILNTRTCQQIETIHDPANKIIAASPPAIADFYG